MKYLKFELNITWIFKSIKWCDPGKCTITRPQKFASMAKNMIIFERWELSSWWILIVNMFYQISFPTRKIMNWVFKNCELFFHLLICDILVSCIIPDNFITSTFFLPDKNFVSKRLISFCCSIEYGVRKTDKKRESLTSRAKVHVFVSGHSSQHIDVCTF